MISFEHRLAQLRSAIENGGLWRLAKIIWERKRKGYSQRSLTYSWPKKMVFKAAVNREPVTYFLLPHLMSEFSFAGLKSALDKIYLLLRQNVSVCIICWDYPGSLEAFKKAYPEEPSNSALWNLLSLKDVSLDKKVHLDLSEKDTIVCTAWWTKLSVDQAEGLAPLPRQVVYLVQDYEPLFYSPDDSVEAKARTLATQSYTSTCCYEVNSSYLADYLLKHNIVDSKKCASWMVFAPMVSAEFEKVRSLKKKKQIFVYARPEVARNRFDLCLRVLKNSIQAVAADWEILGLGSLKHDVALGPGRILKAIPKLGFDDYVVFAGETALAMSLMESPHPSHPPLEFFNAGAVVLTNSFDSKDLSFLGSNMICAKLEEAALTAAFLEGLKRAEKLCEN